MKNKILKINFFVAIIFIVQFFIFKNIYAAEFLISSEKNNININDDLEISFFINTKSESINAIEGEIIFDNEFFDVDRIKDGNSILNIWIEKPIEKNNKILFSGIIPGGYIGEKGFLFSVFFKSKKSGYGLFEMGSIKVLINDGNGSQTKVEGGNIEIFISENINKNNEIIIDKNDSEAPEFFEPIITKNEQMFNNKYFLVFNAQDKDSGISHYEICEGNFKCLETTENNYIIQSQKLNKEIIIKAFDKNNNYRIVIIPPKNNIPWYKNNIYFAIILLGLSIIFILIKKKYKKSS